MDGAHPELVEPVLPSDGHSVVIKARHSIFYRWSETLPAELCRGSECLAPSRIRTAETG